MAETFYIVCVRSRRNYKRERRRQLHATLTQTCQTKSFLFSRLTTQPRGLNVLSFVSRSLNLSPVPSYESLTASRPALERRILAAIDASPSRIPVVLGDFRTGRTQLLYRLRERLGRTHCQHVDLERAATTPERFYQAHHRRVAIQGCRRVPSRRLRATRSTRTLAFLDQSRSRRRPRARDVSARRGARAAHVRELSRAAHGAARVAENAHDQLEPLRSDDALCLTRS